jgi:hypothetical protein
MQLADLLERRGDVAGARLAVTEALDRYRRKGSVLAAARAEARMEALAPV